MQGTDQTSKERSRLLTRRLAAASAGLVAIGAMAFGAIGATADNASDNLGQAISNETTTTRYAFADSKAPILAAPKQGAKKIGKLSFATLEGQPEVYLALRQAKVGKTLWLKIRVPAPPNGTTGWVPQSALLPLQTVHTQLVIDQGSLRATLYKKGKQIFSGPIGVGKSETPTPNGNFYIREGLAIDKGGPYGDYAFGTSDFSPLDDWPFPGPPTVGIHGTNEPDLIPGRVSHGCVRMLNSDINKLKKLMPVGTPVLIK